MPRPPEYLDAASAAALLGVDRRTLYSYASRGLVRRAEDGARRLYVAEDVRRLAARSAARRGHAAVASGALAWGEPVLDTAISGVVDGRIEYRGRSLDELVRTGASYEDVGDLLLGDARGPWTGRLAVRASGVRPLDRLLSVAPALARAQGEPGPLARRIVRGLASTLGPLGPSVAQSVARGFGTRHVRALEVGLVVCADHELNPSTFASRIAAGAGASLGACVGAALFVVSGLRHGAASDGVEAEIDALPARHLGAALRARVRAGERLPGFGHRLHPGGDPRARLLLELVTSERALAARCRAVLAYSAAGTEACGEPPTVDVALAALRRAVGAPPGSAAAIFALGRAVGWLAHALEQQGGTLLRPRARYRPNV